MNMVGIRVARFAAIAIGLAGLYATPAAAQATRTWVSGVGDDANPCSRTAPCKTFAGAISKTAAGGEINCLDPAGFGAVTITKSITIDCTGTLGGVLASSTSGIVVNGAGANVVLRGLEINGGPTASPGTFGVRFLQGNSLAILESHIANFRAAGATTGFGISFAPNTAARLYVHDVTIINNGSGATGGGVQIKPTATGTTNVVFENVRILNNANNAIAIDTTGLPSVAVAAMLNDVQLTGSTNGLSITAPAGGGVGSVVLTRSLVEQNSGNGIGLTGPGANVSVSASTITGNGTGVFVSGGGFAGSYGDNLLDGNAVNGAFTGAVLPKR